MPKLISQKNFTNIETNHTETTSTSQQVIDAFSKNRFRSVKYQVQVTNDTSHHTTEILLVHDGVITYLTEYNNTKNLVIGGFGHSFCDYLVPYIISKIDSSLIFLNNQFVKK